MLSVSSVRDSKGASVVQQSATTGSTGSNARARFVFDARRWTRYEVITAGLSIAMLAFLARPWYDVRFVGCPPEHPGACLASVTGSVRGTEAQGFLWLTLLPCLIILAILVLRAGFGRVPFLLWPNDRQLLAGAASTNLIIVLVAFMEKAGYISPPNPHHYPIEALPPPVLSVTWESGAYIALATAAASAVAAVLNLTRRGDD